MDITQIDEKWVDIDRGDLSELPPNSVIRVSNTGKYQKKDGKIGILKLRQMIRCELGRIYCHRIIAEHFLITVKRHDQKFIDHITHNPAEYNVNDIRNLRWCTQKENCNFDEAISNKSGENNYMYGKKHTEETRKSISKSLKGLFEGENNPMYGRTGDKCPAWKGDYVGPYRLYQRALIQYRAGEISEEEFQHYRDEWARYLRQRRIAKKTLSDIWCQS